MAYLGGVMVQCREVMAQLENVVAQLVSATVSCIVKFSYLVIRRLIS
jgi:hypothetical protein